MSPTGTPTAAATVTAPAAVEERGPGSVDDPGHDVAAEFVGAEPMRPGRPVERRDEVLFQGIDAEPVGEERDQRQPGEEEHAARAPRARRETAEKGAEAIGGHHDTAFRAAGAAGSAPLRARPGGPA